ncbi:histidine phosphatase family protein [Treponema putidum]|uniref:Histidine phosphatase family protein n=1 Tax=Treponema putidum TaxID=221027 RepID=A0AAE9SKS7_9SPIR|nr:histidine phosphatase family protein [Treponema putidum]AIN94136.1 phosphoglycerate mutase [Treponema putidum]TWI79593.1 alpha-ribazole phosphatase/probable phosphoglycerate mutase [Treponema putidum]UTY28083.1 histidine phosphatase family protein [Treponema putidum]UTY30582.1 histidine phosphatase family protein [Treponema putidum]UTY32989.1 histidine phosphatase family protein [Treponema putidum]
MKIVFIRHGITVTNKKKVFSLDNSPLAEEAYPMLDLLKPRLKEFNSFKVYSSPFKRALQTAEYLGFKNIQTDKRLQEYNFGIFKGLTFEETQKKYPIEAKNWIENNDISAPPEGETSFEHFKRTSDFLEELALKDEDSIIVTHYGTITMALAWALDNFSLRNKFAPKNSAVSILEIFLSDNKNEITYKGIEVFNGF